MAVTSSSAIFARYDIAFRIGLFKYVRKTVRLCNRWFNHALQKAPSTFRKATVRSKSLDSMRNSTTFSKPLNERRSQILGIDSSRNPFQGSAPPGEIMSDLDYELEPFVEPWVVEWARWDNETRPWPEPM